MVLYIIVVKILDTHHCRSPLVQGGLEIPIQESLVKQYYKEPLDGKFEDVTDIVLVGHTVSPHFQQGYTCSLHPEVGKYQLHR